MEEKPIHELHAERIIGIDYSMFVYEDRVIVQTQYNPGKLLKIFSLGLTKFQSMNINRNVTTYISDMTSVIYKKADSSLGQIGFSVPGVQGSVTGTVAYFRADQNDVSEKIANFLKSVIKKLKESNDQGNSVSDEIRKLKTLLDENIITQEEFDAKKKQLLGL